MELFKVFTRVNIQETLVAMLLASVFSRTCLVPIR